MNAEINLTDIARQLAERRNTVAGNLPGGFVASEIPVAGFAPTSDGGVERWNEFVASERESQEREKPKR